MVHSEEPLDPAVLAQLIESLEALQADPESLPQIQEWMTQYERNLADEQDAAQRELADLNARLEEARIVREELRSRLDALEVAVILLDDPESTPRIAAAPAPELSPTSSAAVTDLVSPDGTVVEAISAPIDFAKDIYPIFEQKCFSCHGPEKQRGQLRLDAREVVLKEGGAEVGIHPGNGRESELFRRVAGLSEEDQMPPMGEKLTGREMGLILAWIDQGANWPEGVGSDAVQVAKHWAYVPPVRSSLPQVQKSTWPRNPIDAFVLSRLEKEGLAPSPDADPAVLLRRASLDLIGLPPSPSELDAFLSDPSPDAYEKAIDRLLASPHYGERWAAVWLDLARYADTNGYEKDLRREIWPWRDWVIQAFNENKPFDQFTIEQIAGDLLPNPSRDQLVATGFHRNTMLNDEGGIDPEEFRIVAVKDRIETTGAVWLGTTLNCAQCHDHKFDPFSQKEYYQLLAYFNSDVDMGRGQEPVLELPSTEQTQERERLWGEIGRLKNSLNTQTPELDQELVKWETEIRQNLPEWTALSPDKYASSAGSLLTQLEDRSLLAVGNNPANDVYEIEAKVPLEAVTALQLEALTHETLPEGGPGRRENGGFVLEKIEVEVIPDGTGESTALPVRFSDAFADHTEGTFDVKSLVGLVEGRGWATDSSKDGMRVNRAAIFAVSNTADLKEGMRLRIRLTHHYGRGHNLGRFRLSVTQAPDPLREKSLPAEIRGILAVAPPGRSATEAMKLADYRRTITPLLDDARSRLSAAQEELKSLPIPTTMVMRKLEAPRPTHILTRGNFLAPSEQVEAGVPQSLHPFPENAPKDRLGFAQWLVDRDNPLTARVFVNRVWLAYFGQGLVKTSEDFGTQGDPPTHTELLDWLAVEFMESGWDVKALHRTILTSSVYRQTSRVPEDLLERDPNNSLLARGPRLRLEAEAVRDNALAISGLLNRKIGGPSVFPPQPEGVWGNSFAVHDTSDRWSDEEGPNRFRRGIYTFIRRTSPYPTMLTFDAPFRDVCTIQRPRTNTPLQALVTLNDPVFMEASGGLARRILEEGGEDFQSRVRYGFKLCTARTPSDEEIKVLANLCAEAVDHYRRSPDLARAVSTGARIEWNGLDPFEFAAWTLVSNVLLNMNETLTKG